jgi:hypothetical protein
MTLPNATAAVVEIEKLRDYCLDPDHPRGKHKARVLRAALGITQEDSESLRLKILDGVGSGHCEQGECDDYGTRFSVELNVEMNGMHAIICTGWIVRTGEDFPRLTTCYAQG